MTPPRCGWLTVAGLVLGLVACGDRAAPPPPADPPPPPAPQVVDTPPPDTLRGDSIMVRDTARIPQ